MKKKLSAQRRDLWLTVLAVFVFVTCYVATCIFGVRVCKSCAQGRAVALLWEAEGVLRRPQGWTRKGWGLGTNAEILQWLSLLGGVPVVAGKRTEWSLLRHLSIGCYVLAWKQGRCRRKRYWHKRISYLAHFRFAYAKTAIAVDWVITILVSDKSQTHGKSSTFDKLIREDSQL